MNQSSGTGITRLYEYDPIIMKEGDTLPALEVVLYQADGTVLPIATATVSIRISDRFGNEIVNKPAEIVDEATSTVRYKWIATETAKAGHYFAEFTVRFATGDIATIPNGNYIPVEITKKL